LPLSADRNAITVGGMVWGVKRTHKRIAAAVALLGVAFYALLLPWHLTSQFNAHLRLADLGEFAGAICSSDSSKPAMPATSCPICKGLAAFQLALAAPEAAPLPVLPHATPVLSATREDVAELAAPSPHSRGPPSLLA